MISIDVAKCTGCGQCISVCPVAVLRIGTDGVVIHSENACIACMHCAAICARQAISFDGEPAVKSPVMPLAPNCAEGVERLIYQRRSYRKFLEKPVPRALLEQALSAAMIAPSAKNEHPTRWMILEDTSLQQEIMAHILQYCEKQAALSKISNVVASGTNPVMGNHAGLLIAYCPTNAINPTQDTAIAITTAELILQANGVGTCWGGYLTRFLNQIPQCRKLLHLPDDYNVYGTLMYGYPEQIPYRYVPKRIVAPEIQWK